MGVIFYFSNQANSNQVTEEIFGGLNYFVRKGAHMTEYAILFLLCQWFKLSLDEKTSPSNAPVSKKLLKLLPSFAVAVFYAMSDEWHQSFVPGRSALFSDVLIDSTGAAIAALIWYGRLK
jgi:VanZ family protein